MYLGAIALSTPDKYKILDDLMNVLIDERNRKVWDRLAVLKKKKEAAEVNQF